ncbi:hypothetical protein, partial [Klebsiella pneumoniae]|uniref:hypothetical protein n=1 Tax=Klebsiella pneumoniae TaxID=573 RepID=UPI001D0EB920
PTTIPLPIFCPHRLVKCVKAINVPYFGRSFLLINLMTGQYIAQKQHLPARRARSYLKGKIVIETSGKYKTIHFCVSSSFKVNIKSE